jgi:hypothetical protein
MVKNQLRAAKMAGCMVDCVDLIDPETPFTEPVKSERCCKQRNHSQPNILHPWFASQCSDLTFDLAGL